MNSRSLSRLTVFVVFAFSLAARADQDMSAERAQFKRAFDALTTGRTTQAEQLIQGLEDYPLYMHFRYRQLKPRLYRASEAEVRRFLSAYDDSILETLVRREWLKLLGERKHWQAYFDDYEPQDDTRLKCLHLSARIHIGAMDGLPQDTRSLWLSGKSQPDECDPAFAELKASPLMNDDLIWQRIRLAMERGNAGLSRYLGRGFSTEQARALLDRWIAVHRDPAQGLRHGSLQQDTPRVREIVGHGIRRIARRSVTKALGVWGDAESRYAFSAAERGRIQAALAIAAVRQDRPERLELLDQVVPEGVDTLIDRYRLREAIGERDWTMLARWTERTPSEGVNALRWRYWRARALEESGRAVEAEAIYRGLAGERDYYGFLAADRLGLPYQMNFAPVAPEDSRFAEIRARPGIIRARELYLLDMRFWARREWHFEIQKMSRPELEAAAKLAHEWGWYDRGILTLGKAQSYDDLEIRFPIRYLTQISAYAKKRNIDAAVLFSIIRAESAFMEDARSPAGALGLMQLMPQTGRDTARRLGLKIGKARDLLDVDRNITIGSKYLQEMLDRFNGNLAMAAAAYNAGPHRVKTWRPKRSCVPADLWIDMIPFVETRRYVRRALFYAAVYEWRLEQAVTPLNTRLVAIPGRAGKSHGVC
jgi:soluble lytic murein transglycosylase